MNERLKFRVWDEEDEKMIYLGDNMIYEGCVGYLFGLANGRVIVEDKCDHSKSIYISDNDYPIMQCTGLKDKNGKLIFEGDVVKGGIYYDFWKDDVGEVKFGEYYSDNSGGEYGANQCWGWYVEPIKGESKEAKEIYDRRFLPKSFEVIGNIYKNPELLSLK